MERQIAAQLASLDNSDDRTEPSAPPPPRTSSNESNMNSPTPIVVQDQHKHSAPRATTTVNVDNTGEMRDFAAGYARAHATDMRMRE